MICENYFCIYWEKGTCILSDISLDTQGECRERMDVDVDEAILLRQRKKALAEFHLEKEQWRKK